MAKKTNDTNGPWGNMRPGRHTHEDFDHLVSPLGRDGAETSSYSPDECIDYKVPSNQRHDGPHEPRNVGKGRPEGGGGGPTRASERARNDRRGG